METAANKLSENRIHWLNIAEIVTVTGSIGGSIACIWLQKFVYASIPLSASVVLNLLNRRRMIEAIARENQAIIVSKLEQSNNNNLENIQAEIQTQDRENKSRYSDLAQKIKQLQNITDVELTERFQAEDNKITGISREVTEIRNYLSQQNTLNQSLNDSFSKLTERQSEFDRVVREMRVLGNDRSNIILEENTANSYYEKALVYQENGYYDRAKANYQQALQLKPNFAEVYHHRGLLYQEIGQNRQAHEDFKKASQLYFEKRDLNNYNLTRDLRQQAYRQDFNDNSLEESAVGNKVAVDELFSQ